MNDEGISVLKDCSKWWASPQFPGGQPPASGRSAGCSGFYLELLGGDINVQDAPSN